MTSDEEIQNALAAIYSRLGTVEGKVTLIARADRDRILSALKDVVSKSPIVGQIYLVLDGKRAQRQILEELGRYGITTSEATVSRKMGDMSTEHGIADLVKASGTKVYRKNHEMEAVLNLSKNVVDWLTEAGARVPIAAPKTRRKK